MRGVLSGDIQDAKRDMVLLNAAAALMVGGMTGELAEGVEIARQSIDSGAALSKLERLVSHSQEMAQ